MNDSPLHNKANAGEGAESGRTPKPSPLRSDLTLEAIAPDELLPNVPAAERWIFNEINKMQEYAHAVDMHRRKAMAGIAERFHQRLLRFCMSKLSSNREEAEDVVQEVLQDVERFLHRVENEEHLRNLLFKLAKNKCSDVIARHRRITLSNEIRYPPMDELLEEEETHDAEALRRAIKALPKLEDRILLTLSLDYHMSIKHIANILEISEGACKMRRHRARHKLRVLLEKE